jgi:hypothetical protein
MTMSYVSVEHQKIIAPKFRTATLIVSFFALSVIVYLILARLITPSYSEPGSESWQGRVYAGVLILGLLTVVLRRLLMSGAAMKQAAAGGVEKLVRRLVTVTILLAALAELIAVLGLILYLRSADYQYSWRLGMVGLFLLAYAFPRRREWEHIVTVSIESQRT